MKWYDKNDVIILLDQLNIRDKLIMTHLTENMDEWANDANITKFQGVKFKFIKKSLKIKEWYYMKIITKNNNYNEIQICNIAILDYLKRLDSF